MPTNTNHTATRSYFDSQLSYMTELIRKGYDSLRRLSELNLQLAQDLSEDSVNAGRRLLNCSDFLQLTGAAAAQLQPLSLHLQSYQQQLIGVLIGVPVHLSRVAETYLPATVRDAAAAAEDLARRSIEATNSYVHASHSNGATHGASNGSGASPMSS